MSDDEPNIEHFSGTILKTNAQGQNVMSSYLEGDEKLVTPHVAEHGLDDAEYKRRTTAQQEPEAESEPDEPSRLVDPFGSSQPGPTNVPPQQESQPGVPEGGELP